MSFKDIIKDSIVSSFAGGTDLSFWSIFIILLISCLIGVYIFFVYKNFSKIDFYSKDLNITITGMVIVVAAIMVAMQANLLVSLGMVGALSIVRFRTAIKNPIDLLYLFWAISEGIICGVGLYVLGISLCVIMTIMLYALDKIPNSRTEALLILKMDSTVNQDNLLMQIKKHSKFAKSTSVVIKNQECEIIYEVETLEKEELIKEIISVEGVKTVNYVDHSGKPRL